MTLKKITSYSIASAIIASTLFIGPEVKATNIEETKQLPTIAAVEKIKSQTKREVEILKTNVFLDGEKLQLGKKEGYFYTEGKYVNPTIVYDDTIYVPLEYFSHLTPEYQIYYEDGTVYVNSPEETVKAETKVETKKETSSKEITQDDLTLLGVDIKIMDDATSTIKRLKSKYKGLVISQSDDKYYITDSIYTDTSYFLAITKNSKGKIVSASYDEFIRPDQGSLNVKTKRGIATRTSKVKDVIKAYGNDYEKESYTYPDGSSIYTLKYDFKLENGLVGSLTFMADVQAKQNVNDAAIYSIDFDSL